MAQIILRDVTVDLPIFNAHGRSLKQRVIGAATGGRIGADKNGRVVVRGLENVSIELRDGDRVGLVGHNGAGKTTLLRVLSGAFAPTGGSVKIDGEVGSLIDISLGIDPEVTGRDNITLRGALLGMTKPEIRDHTRDIIEFADLGDFVDMPVRTYSAGMHLRLAFAISTAMAPDILLMDEWLSSGDENFKSKIEKRLNDVVSRTSILVVASHSRELLTTHCNRLIWLKHGRLQADDKPEKVVAKYFGH